MKVEYFADTDSLFISLSLNPSTNSKEISEGVVLDYDVAGNLSGIDVDNASQKIDLHEFSVTQLPYIKQAIPA